jgi:Fe-S oxidoreductase
MSHVVFPILWALALAVFGGILAGRARLLLVAKPASRFDHIGARVKRTVVDGVAQRKFLLGEQPAGIMHALIFWGFVVLMLQVATLFGRAFDSGWNIPGFAPDQPLGPPFFLARDVLEVTVIVGAGYMLYRRLIAHTPRLFGAARGERRYHAAPHWEATLILVFIVLIMLGGLVYDAGNLVAHNIHGNERDFAPFTAVLAAAFGGLSRSAAHSLSEVGWWVHCATILVFLNLLPLSKHFHIITALPNVFLTKLAPRSVERPAAIDREPAAGVAALDPPAPGTVGVSALADLNWKQVLDTFTCTECGRCTAVCPAAAGGTPLAPRQVILDLRDQLYHPNGGGSDLIEEDVLWSCTMCMACVEACPVGIEHVPTIVDMRRSLVDQGRMDPLLQQTLEKYAMQGNSYGKSARMRARWTKALDFKIPDAREESVDYVWFVGDFASFDERVQRASQNLARLLQGAGISFGLLYEGERNSGNDVRRIGEEGLFEMLVEQNMSVLAQADFKAIFTTDPHSLNTLRNEYPQYGLDKPVYHYTELLAELVAQGRIALTTPLTGTRVTYHDPCYLARYNRITEAPRKLIEATGAELVEMPRHGVNTFCCGAGGGRIWMSDTETMTEERPSEQRIREAQSLGHLDYFLVSCPKDLAMYSDAVKTVGAEFEVAELTVLIERALGEAAAGGGAGAAAAAGVAAGAAAAAGVAAGAAAAAGVAAGAGAGAPTAPENHHTNGANPAEHPPVTPSA